MHRPLGFFLALSLLLTGWMRADAQSAGYEYFDETGHNLQGAFYEFYHQAPNPTLVYGYPITEEFTRPDGLRVQYFQRARFELHPELPAGSQVLLSALGSQLYTPASPVNIYSPFACRYYSETGYSICFEFLQFFDDNGGEAQFGRPISPFESHDGAIVQYFERARLEWQPWRLPDQRVVLSDLGRIAFDKLGEDPGLLPPAPSLNANIEPAVLNMNVRAFVWKAVTLSQDDQVVYAVLRDQRGQAISGGSCTVAIQWPDGSSETLLDRTDAQGVAHLPVHVTNQPQGKLAVADVTCVYENLTASSTASFRVWW